MIWAIIIAVVGFFIFNMISNNHKDGQSLAGATLEKKFNILITKIINEGFNGDAIVKKGYDNSQLQIFNPEGTNHFVELLYSYGNLQVTWKYKFYQKEMIYNRSFLNVRNLSSFEEVKIANILIQEVTDKIQIHENNVLSNF